MRAATREASAQELDGTADAIRRRLVVTGRVQGVFYRAWLSERARSLGVAGWVRNRADGSVEALFQGSPEAVTALIELAHGGPPASRVDDVAVTDDAPAEELVGFNARPTL